MSASEGEGSPSSAQPVRSSAKKRSFGAISDDNCPAAAAGGGGTGSSGAGTAAGDAGLALTESSQGPSTCKGSGHARYCRIADTDSICLDANLSDDFKWPSDRMRSKGGLSEWPLWGWLGALQGRTGKVVHIWDRKPKDGREKAAVVPKKCCKGSRQAGFRMKDAASDAMEKTMLLLEIDKHFVPILEEVCRVGTEQC